MPDIVGLIEDARVCHLSGDMAAARDAFLSVLQNDPCNATALHHLALMTHKWGFVLFGAKL